MFNVKKAIKEQGRHWCSSVAMQRSSKVMEKLSEAAALALSLITSLSISALTTFWDYFLNIYQPGESQINNICQNKYFCQIQMYPALPLTQYRVRIFLSKAFLLPAPISACEIANCAVSPNLRTVHTSPPFWYLLLVRWVLLPTAWLRSTPIARVLNPPFWPSAPYLHPHLLLPSFHPITDMCFKDISYKLQDPGGNPLP